MVFQVDVRVNVADFGPIVRDAVKEVEKNIRERSRQDIAGSGISRPGKFVKGLRTQTRKLGTGYVIQVTLRPSYAKIWEYGGTSTGKPLLWIPLPPNRTKLRNWAGKLNHPRGSRVLLGGSGRKQVKFVGVTSVTNRQRFHLRQIAVEEANKFLQQMQQSAQQR